MKKLQSLDQLITQSQNKLLKVQLPNTMVV
jgi:hypothetical protein